MGRPLSCARKLSGRGGETLRYGRAGLVSLWPHRELVGSQEVVAPVPSVLDRVWHGQLEQRREVAQLRGYKGS